MTNITNADGDPLRDASGVELYALTINGVSSYKHEDNRVAFNSNSAASSLVRTVHSPP